MGSGDPSGLQNRRELASLALVSSTLTRFRHIPHTPTRDSKGLTLFNPGDFLISGG